MKNFNQFFCKLFCSMFLLVFFLSLGFLNAKPAPPPEMEAWLKKAELGAYEPKKENWDDIVKKAKEEGEVIVYTSSGRIQKLVKPFQKLYPGIPPSQLCA